MKLFFKIQKRVLSFIAFAPMVFSIGQVSLAGEAANRLSSIGPTSLAITTTSNLQRYEGSEQGQYELPAFYFRRWDDRFMIPWGQTGGGSPTALAQAEWGGFCAEEVSRQLHKEGGGVIWIYPNDGKNGAYPLSTYKMRIRCGALKGTVNVTKKRIARADISSQLDCREVCSTSDFLTVITGPINYDTQPLTWIDGSYRLPVRGKKGRLYSPGRCGCLETPIPVAPAPIVPDIYNDLW